MACYIFGAGDMAPLRHRPEPGDYVIVADGDFVSLADNGFFRNL